MRIDRKFYAEVAKRARRDYERWRRDNPGENPIYQSLPHSLCQIERAAQNVTAASRPVGK